MADGGLKKSAQAIAARLPLIGRFFRLDEELLQQIEETLLACDLGVDLTEQLVERLRYTEKQAATQLHTILKQALVEILKPQTVEAISAPRPLVILLVGVNGTGKTTTLGKLAYYFRQQQKQVLVAAADTFRAAAYEQLQIWAQKAGAVFLGNPQAKDPAAVAFDAVQSALKRDIDVVLIDTAGRIHTKSNLMSELAKIKRVIQKVMPTAPQETWLVLDGNTGNNALAQAQEFLNAVGLTGIIVTKLDGTAKGGIVLAIHQKMQLPIKFIGVGEQITDLLPFEPQGYVEAMLTPNK